MSDMPTWEGFMVPVLTVLSDGESRSTREIRSQVFDLVDLTEEQRTTMLPSGRVTRAADRISWAIHFLNRVEAITRPQRATYHITDTGHDLLQSHPNGLTESDLKPLARDGDDWWSQRSGGGSTSGPDSPTKDSQVTPEEAQSVNPSEQIEDGIARIHDDVAAQLLELLLDQDPDFFEEAVVELLLAMGYGGLDRYGSTTQRSNDGGIDGIINQDVLGLNKVYIQAKRYSPGNPVGRPEVQGFVGALSGKADGGVFITTSRFSPGALEWAENVPTRIILIDGKRLTELMIEYGVGVQVERTYRVVEVDEDFFS